MSIVVPGQSATIWPITFAINVLPTRRERQAVINRYEGLFTALTSAVCGGLGDISSRDK